MDSLLSVNRPADIPFVYRDTPIGRLLEYQNLKRPLDPHQKARLLIGMCMDHRKHLRIPDNFSYIIRSGGANLRYSAFKISYAIAVGGVQHIALIGHNHCGMVNIDDRKEMFIQGMMKRAGWSESEARNHFAYFAPRFEIGNAADFILSETARLRMAYPKVMVAPLFYLVEDNRLYLLPEDPEGIS